MFRTFRAAIPSDVIKVIWLIFRECSLIYEDSGVRCCGQSRSLLHGLLGHCRTYG